MGKSCQPSVIEQGKLEQWIAAHGTPQQVALRCRIVVAAAAGESDIAIAKQLAVNRNTVILWRKRFGEEGLDVGGVDLCICFDSKSSATRMVRATRQRFRLVAAVD